MKNRVMDCGRGYGGGSDILALIDSSNNSLWVPSSSPPFHETMVNFDQELQQGGRKRDDSDEGEELDRQPEKKRRLTTEQVQFLEKSFEVENKLEPERKLQLAKQLGLQPRQVAIWFQNRRARFKTKQLERDYDSLRASYNQLKDDYNLLAKEKEDLQNEVKALTKKLKQRDSARASFDPDSKENPLHSDYEPKTGTNKVPQVEVVTTPSVKQTEDASSAKSDVFDSESPHCTDGNYSSLLEDPTASSAHILDPELQSDFSQDEEERHLMMSKNVLPTTTAIVTTTTTTYNDLLKVEEGYDPNGAPCNFSLIDDQPFWSWLY